MHHTIEHYFDKLIKRRTFPLFISFFHFYVQHYLKAFFSNLTFTFDIKVFWVSDFLHSVWERICFPEKSTTLCTFLLWRISPLRFLSTVKWCWIKSQIFLNPTFERYFVTVWNIWPPPRRVFQTNPQNVCATVAMEHPKWSEIRYIFILKYSTSLSDKFRKRLHYHCFNFHAGKMKQISLLCSLLFVSWSE